MTDQEQMEHWNNLWAQMPIGPTNLPYKSLEEYCAARHEAYEAAKNGDEAWGSLLAQLISEEDWWDPSVPS